MGAGTQPGVVPRVKGLNCPNCGASLTLRASAHTLTVVCENCQSILDARDPILQVLQKFEAKTKVRPFIPLGSRGELGGHTFEVIGFQVRTIVVEGTPYSWREYLLFNPYKGFRYLTEYDGHWNNVGTVKALPEAVTFSSKPAVALSGQRYKHFQTATAKTTYVLGEFPWQVRVGEQAVVKDYIAPPRMLSSETTEPEMPAAAADQEPPVGTGWSETVWSLGAYLPGERVWQIFKLPGSAPQPTGIFANQPSPYQGKVKRLWRLFLAFLAVLAVMAMLFLITARREEVFRQSYNFARKGGDTSLVTDVFELKGRTSNVELSIRTDLSQNWTYFNFALINEETGQAYDFGREVSYYYGRDSDGFWTEGSPDDRALIPSVPPGRYYLRVEPELNSGEMKYELRLRRDVPSVTMFWIAAALLLVPPIAVSLRAASFEGRRWQESEYAVSLSSEDEE